MFDYQRAFQRNKQLKLGPCGHWERIDGSSLFLCLIQLVDAEEPVIIQMGVSENVVYPEKPNGFADHYPYEKWLFHWEY